MEKLTDHYRRQLETTETHFLRYLYSEINWEARMIGLTGPRGVGKTTLVLQYIKLNLSPEDALYVTVEDFYFAENRLLDLADTFSKHGGKYLFIDEIHRYPDWSKELKLMYDYYPKLKVVFTGSSVLDIKKGAADLSRRALMYHMQGLSFREYLKLFQDIDTEVYSLNAVLENKVQEPALEYPLKYFKAYLRSGYYPFALDGDFSTRLQQVINQTLETDIPLFANMNVSTGRKLKHLLSIIARSVPFKPNFSKLAELLSVSRNNVADYCLFIEEAGLIAQLREPTSGIRGLGKVQKVFLDNTNLIYDLGEGAGNIGNIRETFFLNQTRMHNQVFSSKTADFQIDDFTFEIGGKNKSKKQIATTENAFVVKDDIEYGFGNTLPLWAFGLMY